MHTPGNGKGRNRTAATWAPTPTTASIGADTGTADSDHDQADTDSGTVEPDANDTAITHAPSTDTGTATHDAATDSTDTTPDAGDTDADTSGTGADVPGSTPPPQEVSAADQMKVRMVATILGDHPDGVTASDIVAESGMRAQIVGRVLTAMELAAAATRATDEAGNELWTRTPDADLTAVNPAHIVAWRVCPTCGHRSRIRNGVTVGRSVSTEPGRNSDGQPTLAKGALRGQVKQFLDTHPDHDFTPTTIAKEIGRSSGAIGNALGVLVSLSQATLVKEVPMTYTSTLSADASQ